VGLGINDAEVGTVERGWYLLKFFGVYRAIDILY